MDRSGISGGRLGARVVAAVLGASLAAVPGLGTAAASDNGPIVWTDSGPVSGTTAQDYRSFQGIPYAAPPSGALRWRAPQPVRRWQQPRDATKPGNRCAQGQSFAPPSTSEDCLYLNVTTPRKPGLKPVMVFLHGGGNSYGAGADYEPHRLAVGGDVVVVTVNYRLGKFGSFGYPGLAGSGDFGLQDQQAALRWVRRNAAAFGGNPQNVTLFGQSGGAFDVCGQLTSPVARELFDRAIMQSGSCATSWPANGNGPGVPSGAAWQSLAQVNAQGVELAAKHGCTDPVAAVDCMRKVPAEDLLPQTNELTAVAFGGQVLPENPEQALGDGHFARIPVMSGTTRDEERFQAAYFPPFDSSGKLYNSLLGLAFGGQADTVAARYPVTDPATYRLTWATALTDRVWACPQLTDDRLLAARTATYTYEFADRNAPAIFPFPSDLPSGAYHTTDLLSLFDQPGLHPTFTPAQSRLADQMIRYWSRFAWTGNPNGPDLPRWPHFGETQTQSLAPDDIQPVSLAAEHLCGFWSNMR